MAPHAFLVCSRCHEPAASPAAESCSRCGARFAAPERGREEVLPQRSPVGGIITPQ